MITGDALERAPVIYIIYIEYGVTETLQNVPWNLHSFNDGSIEKFLGTSITFSIVIVIVIVIHASTTQLQSIATTQVHAHTY